MVVSHENGDSENPQKTELASSPDPADAIAYQERTAGDKPVSMLNVTSDTA